MSRKAAVRHSKKAMITRNGRSLLGVGLYPLPQAARLLSFSAEYKVSPQKLRRWAVGYDWGASGGKRHSAGIVMPEIKLDEFSILSFADLIEMLWVAAFRREGVSLPVIRAAHTRAMRSLCTPHPFRHYKFNTDGKGIFHQLTADEIGPELSKSRVVEEVQRSQVVFDRVVEPLYKNLKYVHNVVDQLWPLGQDALVVLDPKKSFGQPIEPTSGVPTYILFSTYRGGEDPEAIATDFRAPLEGVNDAIKYEEALLEAA